MSRIYWMTTELANCGTDTEVFGTQAEQQAAMTVLIENAIEARLERGDEAHREAAEAARLALKAGDFDRAWTLYREGFKADGTGAVKDDDDCVWWGDQEIEIASGPAGKASTAAALIDRLFELSRTGERVNALAVITEWGNARFAEGKGAQAIMELRGRDKFVADMKERQPADIKELARQRDDLLDENRHNAEWILRIGALLGCTSGDDRPEQRIEAMKLELEELRELREIYPVRTDREIVDQTNALGVELLKLQGFEVIAKGLLADSPNPRAKRAWKMACAAQEALTQTDPDDALENVRAEEEAARPPMEGEARPPTPIEVIGTLNGALELVLAHYDNGDKFADEDEKQVWEAAGHAQDLAKLFLPARPDYSAPGVCPECFGKGWEVFTRGDGRKAVQACDGCQKRDVQMLQGGDEHAAKLANAAGVKCRATYPCILEGEPDFEAGQDREGQLPEVQRFTPPGEPSRNEINIGGVCRIQCTHLREPDRKRCNVFFVAEEPHEHEHRFTCDKVIEGSHGDTCDMDEGHPGPCQSVPF